MNTAIKVSLAIGALVTGAGCTSGADDVPDQAEGEAVARATGRTVVKTGGVVATLRATIVAGLEDANASVAPGDVRARIEAAIAALVASADCMSLSWSLWTATVQFDDCRIPMTEERLDGGLGVRVRLLDRSVELTLDQLTVGPDAFDGTVRASVRGPVGALTLGVDADLTLVNDPATLVVDGLAVDANLGGVTMSGSGDVMSPDVDAGATADQLHWVLGDCLPSSGSLTFDNGQVDGVITFLATTPATGEVRLRVGSLPPVIVGMFPTCG